MSFGQQLADLRTRFGLGAVIGLIALLALPAANLFWLLFGSGSELSYSFSAVASTCRVASLPCLSYAELDLGNTGRRPQERIELEFDGLPPWSNVSHHSIKIVASNEPFVRPLVRADAELQRITVEDLAADHMITIQIVMPGHVDREAAREPGVRIHSAGRVIQANPRTTALVRAFRAALAFLI